MKAKEPVKFTYKAEKYNNQAITPQNFKIT